MVLGDSEIKARALQAGMILPFSVGALQPASYDCTLGKEWLVPKTAGPLRLDEEPQYGLLESEQYILPPGGFVLATTAEWFRIPLDVAAQVDGRSSLGRLGITAHVTAGWIDPGFLGRITLEVANHGPWSVVLEAGRRICQVVFLQVQGCKQGYCGKYQGQQSVLGSKLYQDKEVA